MLSQGFVGRQMRGICKSSSDLIMIVTHRLSVPIVTFRLRVTSFHVDCLQNSNEIYMKTKSPGGIYISTKIWWVSGLHGN